MKTILLTLAVDLLGVAGAAAIAYGTTLVYMPAGWIVAGAFLVVGAIVLARE